MNISDLVPTESAFSHSASKINISNFETHVNAITHVADQRLAPFPNLEFIRDHVTQPLVVDNSNKYVGFHFSAGFPRVETLCAVVVVAGCGE